MRALPHGKTVTIVRPGPPTFDDYGNDVPGPARQIDVPGCATAPQDGNGAGGNEILQARDTVLAGLTLYAPSGTDLRPTDRVLVDGVLYEVDGLPGGFASPFTGSSGPLVASLQYITG